MDLTDPYFLLLRRELTRAQARLRRCERDALRAALEAMKTRQPSRKAKHTR
jgi:hypothetical protein